MLNYNSYSRNKQAFNTINKNYLLNKSYKIADRNSMERTETFNERFEKILAKNKIQKKEIAEKIGFSQNGITTWKVTGTIPRADVAIKIARVLGVTVEYLIFGELNNLNSENDLPYRVTALSKDKQKLVKALVDALEDY